MTQPDNAAVPLSKRRIIWRLLFVPIAGKKSQPRPRRAPIADKYIPLVYYNLGQVQEGLKSPAATDSYQTFLEIKKRGDGDIIVEDARKRLAGLKSS